MRNTTGTRVLRGLALATLAVPTFAACNKSGNAGVGGGVISSSSGAGSSSSSSPAGEASSSSTLAGGSTSSGSLGADSPSSSPLGGGPTSTTAAGGVTPSSSPLGGGPTSTSAAGGDTSGYCASVRTLADDMKSLSSGSGAQTLTKANRIGRTARKAAEQAPNADARSVWGAIAVMMDKAAKGDISGVTAISKDPSLKSKADKVERDVRRDCGINLNK